MSYDHDDHSAPAEEYNPLRDYSRFMDCLKYAVLGCIAITLLLRVLIG